jgi:hypothetical protein
MDRKSGAMPGGTARSGLLVAKSTTWDGERAAARRIRLALAAYRRELLVDPGVVDPGVHLRSVETAR